MKTLGLALLLASLVPAASPAQSRVNLPQLRQVVRVPKEAVAAIRAGLAAPDPPSNELSPAVEALLLAAAPQSFREACGALIEHWGEIARGSAEWHVRILHQENDLNWLAFRCRSRTLEYSDFHDECPALLKLDSGRLEFFPLAKNADNDSTLYHLEFSQVVPLEGARGVAFKVSEPAENPCCDGPESRSGETWRIFADTARGVAELLSIVTARDDSSHSDDPEIDSETIYRGQISLQRGPQETVREVVSTFKEEEKEITYEGEKAVPRIASQRSGTKRYCWNSTTIAFEEMK